MAYGTFSATGPGFESPYRYHNHLIHGEILTPRRCAGGVVSPRRLFFVTIVTGWTPTG